MWVPEMTTYYVLGLISVAAVFATLWANLKAKRRTRKVVAAALLILLALATFVVPGVVAGAVVMSTSHPNTYKAGVIQAYRQLSPFLYFNFLIGVCMWVSITHGLRFNRDCDKESRDGGS